jgi:hypothetical protein
MRATRRTASASATPASSGSQPVLGHGEHRALDQQPDAVECEEQRVLPAQALAVAALVGPLPVQDVGRGRRDHRRDDLRLERADRQQQVEHREVDDRVDPADRQELEQFGGERAVPLGDEPVAEVAG